MNSWGSVGGGLEANMGGFLPAETDFGLSIELGRGLEANMGGFLPAEIDIGLGNELGGGLEANMRGFLPAEIDFGLGIKLDFAEGTIPDIENPQTEAIDYAQLDDVAIISPRKFEAAKKNAERRSALRSHAETRSCPFSSNSNDGTPDQPILIEDCDLNLRVGYSRKKQKTADSGVSPAVPPSKHSPEAPKLGCAICMSELNDATATKCGHIFCRACLQKAIISQHKCPTCRCKLRKTDMIRIYLP